MRSKNSIPVIVVALGAMPHSLKENLKKNLKEKTIQEMALCGGAAAALRNRTETRNECLQKLRQTFKIFSSSKLITIIIIFILLRHKKKTTYRKIDFEIKCKQTEAENFFLFFLLDFKI